MTGPIQIKPLGAQADRTLPRLRDAGMNVFTMGFDEEKPEKPVIEIYKGKDGYSVSHFRLDVLAFTFLQTQRAGGSRSLHES